MLPSGIHGGVVERFACQAKGHFLPRLCRPGLLVQVIRTILQPKGDIPGDFGDEEYPVSYRQAESRLLGLFRLRMRHAGEQDGVSRWRSRHGGCEESRVGPCFQESVSAQYAKRNTLVDIGALES